VRDVSKQLHKDIRIDMLGEGTEIDKTIIEQLSDPLTHMIRNSLDHGIEKPEARVAAGKPAQGVITLEADQRGGKIVITIEDDGNGVNREKVLAKAIEKGIV
jgi:two-component system chemotaxis sensor kinase CheA